ncbi:hypothetical protein V493_07027 [Pseudogymnoascus sp. VKM F-4281 (FW-2241)]|nr:hypothetical protein V493_07027 [Pseudogymnoascus sp. VKM F-4281 (FW-2241)]
MTWSQLTFYAADTADSSQAPSLAARTAATLRPQVTGTIESKAVIAVTAHAAAFQPLPEIRDMITIPFYKYACGCRGYEQGRKGKD